MVTRGEREECSFCEGAPSGRGLCWASSEPVGRGCTQGTMYVLRAERRGKFQSDTLADVSRGGATGYTGGSTRKVDSIWSSAIWGSILRE
jgi:hypothetical protein